MKKLLIILIFPLTINAQYKNTTVVLTNHQEKLDSINNYLYELVINYRSENNKSHLKLNKSEESSCLNHCNYMIAESGIKNIPYELSHKETNKSNPYYTGYEFRDRDKTNKFSGGENIASYCFKETSKLTNYEIALTFFNLWKKSKVHNMNMLWDSHNTISSAVSIGSSKLIIQDKYEIKNYLIYATQTFYK